MFMEWCNTTGAFRSVQPSRRSVLWLYIIMCFLSSDDILEQLDYQRYIRVEWEPLTVAYIMGRGGKLSPMCYVGTYRLLSAKSAESLAYLFACPLFLKVRRQNERLYPFTTVSNVRHWPLRVKKNLFEW